MNKDLSTGKPAKVLWLYCLPLLGSILFQQLYNIADSLIAGKVLGENALAAVGNASEITLIYTAFAFGSNIGCSVVVSNLFGAKDYKGTKTCISTSLITFGVLCILLMAFGFAFTNPLLRLMQTPDDILQDSIVYLMIYTAGIPFVFFYNVATGIFSAMGDSKTPFWFLAASSLANILFDYLFVKFTPLGVAGVAVATLLCQGISCLLSLVFLLLRLKKMPSEGKTPLFSPFYFKKICKVALPSILQQGSISVGNIFIQGIVNGYGPAVIAGYTAAIKLNNIATSCFTAVANGLSSYTAQNLGSNQPQRIKPGLFSAFGLGYLVSGILVLVFTLGSTPCIEFFMKETTEEALLSGRQFLFIVSPFYFAVSLKIISDGVLRGSGAMHLFMISTMIDLLLRVMLAFLFSGPFGTVGIWCAWPVGWIVATVISLSFYGSGIWKKSKL